jgi:large-conductance mechanosensitive channel
MNTQFKELLFSLLPFIIIVIIWVVIIATFKKYNKGNSFADRHKETLDVLKEIRDELKELNKNNSQKQ